MNPITLEILQAINTYTDYRKLLYNGPHFRPALIFYLQYRHNHFNDHWLDHTRGQKIFIYSKTSSPALGAAGGLLPGGKAAYA
jgi:hypothetical protein